MSRIEDDLTFVAATNNCQTKSTGEAVLDGDGGSWASSGGLMVISSTRTVTFTRIRLQNAHASLRGGIAHAEEDATLVLDSSRVLSGTAGGEGGGINVNAGGILWMKNGSVVYRNEVTNVWGICQDGVSREDVQRHPDL